MLQIPETTAAPSSECRPCGMLTLLLITSSQEMLLDLQPVSSLNSQEKLANGKRRRLRAAPGSAHTPRLRNFSEEELVDCIGWDRDQFGYFKDHGFMSTEAYPYNTTGTDSDPPVPYKCAAAACSARPRGDRKGR